MAKATWNGVILAESSHVQVVDGYVYFPPESVQQQYLRPRENHTLCSWKGEASYFDIVVGAQVNINAVWHYPATKAEAKHIEGHFAFWNGVVVDSEAPVAG